MRSWDDIEAELVRPEDEPAIRAHADRMRAEVRAHRLAETRKQRGVTQKELAAVLGISQARVSNIERGIVTAAELGTITKYVEALGGRLEIVASFGDGEERMRLA